MSSTFNRHIVTFGLFLASVGTLAGSARGNQLINGNFETPAIVGPGQTPVAPGQSKALNIDPLLPGYPGAIAQIPHWVNSYTDVACGVGCRDAGLSRADFDGSGDTQYAYINNWETRLSQVSAWTLAPGDIIQANTLIGFDGPTKAGKFQLWAGQPSPSDPDQFPGSAVLLAELSAGTSDWANYVPDQALPDGQWHPLQLNYTVPASGPMIGQPLTLSFLTSLYSVGPTYWDNASLTAVPEPTAVSLVALGCVAIVCRTRRRHKKGTFHTVFDDVECPF